MKLVFLMAIFAVAFHGLNAQRWQNGGESLGGRGQRNGGFVDGGEGGSFGGDDEKNGGFDDGGQGGEGGDFGAAHANEARRSKVQVWSMRLDD